MPPWTSFEERDEVPMAKSPRSTSAVRRPRLAASSAQPAPVIPPPTTTTSNSSPARRSSAAARSKRTPEMYPRSYRAVTIETGMATALRRVLRDRAGLAGIRDAGQAAGHPRLHAPGEVHGVVAGVHEGCGGSGRPGSRAADHDDRLVGGQLGVAVAELVERHEDGGGCVPGVPLVLVAHVEQRGAALHHRLPGLRVDFLDHFGSIILARS